MAGVGPGRKPGHDIELTEEAADDLIGVGGRTQLIELRHHRRERLFDVADRPLRVVLALLFETALALDELFAVEIRDGLKGGIRGPRVGQEARQAVP